MPPSQSNRRNGSKWRDHRNQGKENAYEYCSIVRCAGSSVELRESVKFRDARGVGIADAVDQRRGAIAAHAHRLVDRHAMSTSQRGNGGSRDIDHADDVGLRWRKTQRTESANPKAAERGTGEQATRSRTEGARIRPPAGRRIGPHPRAARPVVMPSRPTDDPRQHARERTPSSR
jgi:hypothetical protein